MSSQMNDLFRQVEQTSAVQRHRSSPVRKVLSFNLESGGEGATRFGLGASSTCPFLPEYWGARGITHRDPSSPRETIETMATEAEQLYNWILIANEARERLDLPVPARRSH